jgi:hypothetical protein
MKNGDRRERVHTAAIEVLNTLLAVCDADPTMGQRPAAAAVVLGTAIRDLLVACRVPLADRKLTGRRIAAAIFEGLAAHPDEAEIAPVPAGLAPTLNVITATVNAIGSRRWLAEEQAAMARLKAAVARELADG